MSDEFVEFKKIPRLNRDIVITEKMDGTNAQIFIEQWGPGAPGAGEVQDDALCVFVNGEFPAYRVKAGSRNRWVVPGKDNYGFATWVFANAESLIMLLGEGRHFGEWWGAGVQRKYGVTTKRFSLFNVSRYGQQTEFLDPRCLVSHKDYPNGSWTREVSHQRDKLGVKRCACRDARPLMYAVIGGVPVDTVPVLYRGPWFVPSNADSAFNLSDEFATGQFAPEWVISRLKVIGSVAVPGFSDPEGIVVFHEAGGVLFKITCKDDEKPKGAA